jgi:hypothetical protein
MRNKFLAAVVLLSAATATPVFAGTGIRSNYYNNREIKPEAPVKKIIINGNVDVILTADVTSGISIDGKAGVTAGIKLLYQENELEVIAADQGSKKKHVVRIPVQQLQLIEINGDGKIYSESYIASANLEIIINGACHVNIRSTGNITVKASPEYELTYTKNGLVKSTPDFY